MQRALILIFEILIVFLAVFIADALESHVSFIPASIVELPGVDYTEADFWTVMQFFLLVHLMVFAVMQIRAGVWIISNGKRSADELFALATAFAISALLLFVTTSVAFDPNFMIGIALTGALLFAIAHVCALLLSRSALPAGLAAFCMAILKRTFSVPGILALLIALSPAVLAKLFVSNRDVANVITQVRIYFNQQGTTDYVLVNALGTQRFVQPMLAKSPPGDATRLYILERAGRLVSVAYPASGLEQSTVLDIRDQVGAVESENGALGFAFHPNFGKDGATGEKAIFVYYTAWANEQQVNHLSRFTVSGSEKQTNGSELSLMYLPRESSGFHNGGSVEFGPDGFLYVALGEGVRPRGVSSQSEALRGGILRIDVDQLGGEISRPISLQPNQGSTKGYYIPLDNPFVGRPEIMDEFWAVGLRNPFRMNFDAVTGALWAGDVGSTKWEEVNLIESGKDYQYPYIEGKEKTEYPPLTTLALEQRPPLYVYVHTAYDRAVIGGIVYRGGEFDDLDGKYLFADNYSSKLFAMRADGIKTELVEHIATADQYAQRGTSSITQLDGGEILVTTLGRSSVATGEVLRLVSAGSADQTESVDSGQPAVEIAYSEDEIRKIYVLNCARCHGVEGSGNGPDSEVLGVPLPDFTNSSYGASRSDQQLTDIIEKGGHATGLSALMPAWGHLLSTAEIAEIVAYLRTLETRKKTE